MERLGTREAIIRDWVNTNDSKVRLSARARVDVAIMLTKRGDTLEAIRLLTEQVNRTDVKGHIQYVRALSLKLGLGSLPI